MSFWKRWFVARDDNDPASGDAKTRSVQATAAPLTEKERETLKLLETLTAVDPTNGDAQLGLGMLQLREFAHNPAPTILHEAAMHLAHAVALLPDSADAHFYLAFAQSFALDTVDEAAQHLERALSLNPELAPRAGEIQERIQAARVGMQHQAIEPGALHAAVQQYERAQLLLDEGRASDAIPLLNEAIALYPSYAEALLALGEAYRQLRRVDDGIAAFRRALAVRPQMFQAYVGLGTLYVQRGDHARALDQLLLALEQQPDQPQVLRNVGLLQLATGNHRDAVLSFRRLCALQPDNPEHRLELALAAAKAGDRVTAHDALRRLESAALSPKQHHLAAQLADELGEVKLAEKHRRMSAENKQGQ